MKPAPLVGESDAVGSSRSFTDMVKGATTDAIQTMRNSDVATAAGIRGEIDTQAVVNAAVEAEMTLQTVVSLRDKLVDAYQEVLRMPV
jgi:flagellar hook-basal body complex protein FliE